MQDRRSDLRGKKAQVNQTQQRQSLYDDNEDELDELFEEEEEAADVQKDVKILKTTNTTTTSKHGRVIAEPDDDDDVNGSDGILEDAVEEQENQEKFDEEGDEELESIRMTHGTPKKSHDVVPYEVDELRSSQESDDRFDAMDDDNDNDNTPALPPPTAALSFEQSVYKEKEINGEKDKTIDTTLPTAPEPLKTNLNDPRDCEVSIDSPPLLPVHEQLGSAAPTPNLDGLISKENTDPAAAEKPPVTSKAIERDTITSVLTVAPEATTAQKPSTSPSAATAKETLSDEQTPERQYASTSPPSTTLSSFSSTPLSDDAVHSCEEGSRNQSDPTSLANTANMKNLTGPEHIDEEAGDDDNDDFYSAEQADSPLSDEFVTAQPNRSSSVEGVETDLDYKRMSRHKLTTGYVYDVVMSLHAQLGHAGDDDDPHPEDPRRIYSIYKCMEENGLLNNCTKIPIRQATKAEVLATHDPRYYQTLRQTEGMSRKELEKQARQYNSIYMNAHSHESALFSAGGVIEACSAVVTDKVQNAFAIVRPPGHHAEFDTAMGFCLMNNVAIAARYCKEHFPFVERILILDWDIHFGNYKTKAMHDRERTHDILDTDSGNGTQQLTSSDGDILYISLHRYEKGTFYPQDKHGRHAYVGRGKGRGRTVNIPWPDSGMTDGDYLYAFRQIVMPIAMEFDPSLVIVSAGFDAAAGDQIGECHVTPAGYGQMTHMLKSLANGRVVLALEGGYNLESIAKSAYACMSVLVGESPEIPTLLTPSPECVETVQKVKQVQSQYWDTLKY
ncbi:hypothetical protein BDB00DRAFT_936859 [Zychaea mexicana]|uniref:uncharacterized protein n=1 Tax=Zychaea mexicana TaxID=64656 RepID=UPI0022FE7B7A|nr:uncharacterized protein BDB00DRAFT_936859 [Zychaea mexicana]KAI9496723.1 hypothetical protein BDB00DRAFT_936859 [Zychaea mexicana]